MKKGLAILLIIAVSSSIQAVGGDDVVGIATYQDLWQEFALLFDDKVNSPTVTRERSQSNVDSASPRNSKLVQRVKSQSSMEDKDDEVPANAIHARRQSLERIRQLSMERITSKARTKSKEDVLARQDDPAADAQQQQQQQEDNQ